MIVILTLIIALPTIAVIMANLSKYKTPYKSRSGYNKSID
jgi:hypothetical protein